jgi:hypothetical protein
MGVHRGASRALGAKMPSPLRGMEKETDTFLTQKSSIMGRLKKSGVDEIKELKKE